MAWLDVAKMQRESAQYLAEAAEDGFSRAICSRAYYAAYAAATARLPSHIQFGRGWGNPEHAKLPEYVSQIVGLSANARREVKRGLRRLRHRREDADYRPGRTVDFRTARDSLRDAAAIFYLLNLET